MSAEGLALLVLGGEDAPVVLPSAGMLVVGASAERAGLVVAGQGVDDAHCAIGPVKGGGFAIKDLGSRYGTIVNGKKVAAARLSAGDTIHVGSRRLRVVDARDAAARRPLEDRVAEAPAEPPPEPRAPRSGAAPAAESAPRGVPKTIGGYRVERVLGRGGMGTVLLAVQESLHRPVALKLLPPRLASDADFVRRFQSEARAAAALNHPNVVVVHDVGEADGFHFLSMEYMERGSLEDRLRTEGRLPWRAVLDVLHDAARGLQFAEERGIVHRDVKPANLMQNAAGAIKIADLGLATSVEAEASESDGKRILGTPHFISPEQARGEPVDARSDLYSLGATAYRLLTGRTPFQGETTRDILRGHFTQTPEPPRASVPDVPAELEALVLKLLEKEPLRRYQAAAQLLSDVDRLRLSVDHGVEVGAPAARPRKIPVVPIALVALLIAIGGAAAMMLGGGDSASHANDARAEAAPEPPAAGDGAPADEADLFASDAADAGPDAVIGLEQRMRERNLLAENAYLRLGTTQDRAARVLALERLAEEYDGTDAAARMRAEIAELEQEIAAAETAAAAAAAALAETESALRAAVGLSGSDRGIASPGDALRAARGFELPATAPSEQARALVARVEREIVASARAAFAAELERADALAAEGRFEELGRLLGDLVPRFDLPEYAPGEEPEGLEALEQLGIEARRRLARLDDDARAWAETRAAADRETLVEALRGGALGESLARLDLAGAVRELDLLLERLGGEDARAFARSLLDDLRAGDAMLDGLIQAFGENAWRRRTVVDPRGGRATTREAIGADREGLRVEVEGAPELVPWSAYAGQPAALGQLFKERLSRDYTAREKQGGAALLYVACAQEAARIAAQKVDPGSTARFSEAEAKALTGVYEDVEPWALADPRFAREREAARVLARALSDVEAGVWSAAEASLVTLLSEHGDTLLVALLSDGSRWRAPEPEPEPAEPAEPADAAPAEPADDLGSDDGR